MRGAKGSSKEFTDWRLVRQRLEAAMEATAGHWDPPPQVRQRNMEARARAFARAREAQPASGPAIGAVFFELSETRYAIEACYVNEILRLEELTPLPRTPAFVAGVYNLRGRLLPVFDLRLVLKPVRSTPSAGPWAVACGGAKPELLFLTDAIATIAPDLPRAVCEGERDTGPEWVVGSAADATVILDGGMLLAEQRFFLEYEENPGSAGERRGGK